MDENRLKALSDAADRAKKLASELAQLTVPDLLSCRSLLSFKDWNTNAPILPQPLLEEAFRLGIEALILRHGAELESILDGDVRCQICEHG